MSIKPTIMRNTKVKNLLRCLVVGLSVAVSVPGQAYKLKNSDDKKVTDPNIQTLQKISKGVATISAKARKALVFVSISKNLPSMPPGMTDPFQYFFGPGYRGRGGVSPQQKKQEGLGSGFIVDLAKGYVLTNNHVIEGADEITLKVSSGKSYQAKVVGRDKQTDVAVVKIIGKFSKMDLGELELADSSKNNVGDFVIALGAPFGLEASLSFGVISALGRGNLRITDLGNFIQTDAAINPGNSGGPLLNTAGKVVGINTAIYSKSGGYNGIGFAVPSNIVRKIANQLISKGSVDRGFLGVYFKDVDPELAKDFGLKKDAGGVFVANVEVDSPADKAGIVPGDIIVVINGKKIKNNRAMTNAIGLLNPGKTVEIEFFRDGTKKKTTAKLIARNSRKTRTRSSNLKTNKYPFGLGLENISRENLRQFNLATRKGALITAITPNSAAARANLLVGDVIIQANNQKISKSRDFLTITKNKRKIIVRIDRQGTHLYASLRR